MRKISFLDIILNNNIKLYEKGDQVYNCNLQPWITIFPGSYFIMHFALCRYISIYITWYILHIFCINNYIILWRVKYQMRICQLRVWMSSVLIKLFSWYLISLGLTPAYDTILFFKWGNVAQVIGVSDVAFKGAYCSIIPDFSHGVRTYMCVLIKFCFPRVL